MSILNSARRRGNPGSKVNICLIVDNSKAHSSQQSTPLESEFASLEKKRKQKSDILTAKLVLTQEVLGEPASLVPSLPFITLADANTGN